MPAEVIRSVEKRVTLTLMGNLGKLSGPCRQEFLGIIRVRRAGKARFLVMPT